MQAFSEKKETRDGLSPLLIPFTIDKADKSVPAPLPSNIKGCGN
jgi:hypothetical protein